MNKIILAFTTLMLVSQFSVALAADSNKQMPSRPMAPPRANTIPQLQLTPDLLYQEITTLKQQNSVLNKQVPILNGQVNTLKKQNSSLNQQIQILKGQVNALRSVVQVTATGTTIQAENLSLNAGKTLTMSSGKETNLTTGDDLDLVSGKTLSLQGGKDVAVEGKGTIKLKAPIIKLNDGNKGIALQDSPVAGGKVIGGSTSVFAQ
jgi:FtsZ-binding cell division protein ZapB